MQPVQNSVHKTVRRCLEKNPCKTSWKDWSCLPENLGVLGFASESRHVRWPDHPIIVLQDTASGISEIDRNPKPRKGNVKFIPFELQMFNTKLVASCNEIMTWHSIEAAFHGRFFTKELALKKFHVATLPRHKFLHSPLRLCQTVRFFQGESFRANSPASCPWHRDICSSQGPGRTRHPTVG